jgi:protein subunit release factor B
MFRLNSLGKLFSQIINFTNLNASLRSTLKSIKEPIYPPLNELEIREQYAKGSGPGGQSVNKATNRCQLKHLPTGIIVTCHQTRSLDENRKIARKKLQQQLDLYYNKENSYLSRLQKFKKEEKLLKNKRSIENLQKKKEFKKNEELDE